MLEGERRSKSKESKMTEIDDYNSFFSDLNCEKFNDPVEDEVFRPDFVDFESIKEPEEEPSHIGWLPDEQIQYKEVIVDAKTGLPRQAGADLPEGEFIKAFKKAAEEDLYVFGKGVMNRDYLTDHLHLPVSQFVQKVPPFRKLVLMPREHAKTSIVAHVLPVHILIQNAESNIYFPNLEGCESRILLAGETEGMAKRNLRVIASVFTGNPVFRAFWPERCWEGNPKTRGAKWNDSEIIIPRETEWPDSSVKAIGVGGAITGARPNVLIKDDLISVAAANSEIIMYEAIEWHKVSRALLEEYEHESGLKSLEFLAGTRWAVHDLYSEIQDNDLSVEVIDEKYHAIIKDGVILWPERITHAFIEEKIREYGSMYFLLYLNSAADPSLTDFDLTLIRAFTFRDGKIVFDEDQRDSYLEEKLMQGGKQEVIVTPAPRRGIAFNSANYDSIVPKGRGEFFRLKYG